ncbi:hypothetical protein pb186bvf_010973 [Paramecium bursaria]
MLTPSGNVDPHLSSLIDQLKDLLSKNQRANDEVNDQLTVINTQLEEIFSEGKVQSDDLENFIVSYDDYVHGKMGYQEFKNIFVPQKQQQSQINSQFQQQQINDRESQLLKSQIKQVQQHQNTGKHDSGQFSQLEQQNQQLMEENNDLRKQLGLKDQHLHNEKEKQNYVIDQIKEEQVSLQQICRKQQQEISQQQARIQQLEHQLNVQKPQRVKDQEEKHKQEITGQLIIGIISQKCKFIITDNIKQSTTKGIQVIQSTQIIEQQKLIQDLQQKIKQLEDSQIILVEDLENMKLQNKILLQKEQINNNQQDIQQLLEDCENYKIENQLLQQKIQQMMNEHKQYKDYESLKLRYNNLDTAYFNLLEENNGLKRNIPQTQLEKSQLISEKPEEVKSYNVDYFLNFSESDLWSDEEPEEIPVSKTISDIAHLIYPYKTAFDYYKNTCRSDYKGQIIKEFQCVDSREYRLSCLKQKSLLITINNIEIRQRTQQNNFALFSTTLCLKNHNLQVQQISVNQDKFSHLMIKDEGKNYSIQPKSVAIIEIINKEKNLFKVQTITLLINQKKFEIPLPISIMQQIQIVPDEVNEFRTLYKQNRKIYRTKIFSIAKQQELFKFAKQGYLLNVHKMDDIQRNLCASKYGLKIHYNQQENIQSKDLYRRVDKIRILQTQ